MDARRIIAKVVLTIVGSDVQETTGCWQMCGGQISGIEAAVHATRSAFELEENEAILLVDATNAFNTLNRQVALLNIRRLCPPIATILINSYRCPSGLLVDGDIILSQEGTMQRDSLAMPMYGLATISIIRKLDGICEQSGMQMTLQQLGQLCSYTPGGQSSSKWAVLSVTSQPSQNMACHKTRPLQPGK